jgi:hypothetical protein
MRQVGGLLGFSSQTLQGVNHPFSNTVMLPAWRDAEDATMRVSSLVTSLSASMKPSRKSSVRVMWSAVITAPSGSLMRTLPSAASVFEERS